MSAYDGGAFVDEYTNCQSLRDQSVRFSRLSYGSTNISENGHPFNSGVVDRNTLCAFKPRNDTYPSRCSVTPRFARRNGGTRNTQIKEVRKLTVKQQMDTFRSMEQKTNRTVEQNTRLQQARCAHLLSNQN